MLIRKVVCASFCFDCLKKLSFRILFWGFLSSIKDVHNFWLKKQNRSLSQSKQLMHPRFFWLAFEDWLKIQWNNPSLMGYVMSCMTRKFFFLIFGYFPLLQSFYTPHTLVFKGHCSYMVRFIVAIRIAAMNRIAATDSNADIQTLQGLTHMCLGAIAARRFGLL